MASDEVRQFFFANESRPQKRRANKEKTEITFVSGFNDLLFPFLTNDDSRVHPKSIVMCFRRAKMIIKFFDEILGKLLITMRIGNKKLDTPFWSIHEDFHVKSH